MSKCPICGEELKKKSNKKDGEDYPSVLIVSAKCNNCKQYAYELVGPSSTVWIGDYEFYSLLLPENNKKINKIVLIYKIKYKILKIWKKFTKKS